MLGRQERGSDLGRCHGPGLSPLRLREEPGVVDGSAGGGGQGGDQFLVFLAELSGVLIGQVQIPVGGAAHLNRHTEKAVHRRMSGRDAHGAGIVGQMPQSDRPSIIR